MFVFGEVEALLRDILGNGLTSKNEGAGVRSLDVNIRSKTDPFIYGVGFAGLATFNITTNGDIITIVGSASKVVKIRRVMVSGTGSSAQQASISLIKRSSVNTGGTSAAIAVVPMDSANAAATAVVSGYTAAPTQGAAVGTICAQRKLFPLAGSRSTDGGVVLFEYIGDLQPITLRGVSELLAININSVAGAFTPAVSGCIIFSEE